MPLYRKKPVVVEAMRFVDSRSGREIETWSNYRAMLNIASGGYPYMVVLAHGGEVEAVPGDWVIKGVADDFYPCKPDIFEATYEAVVEEATA